MSFVTITRDYVEFLNNLSDTFSGVIPISEFLKESIIYFLKTIQYVFIYIISFQWIRDFSLLPIVVPQLSTALVKEKFFLESSSNIFFNFLEIPSLRQNSFILGFFNSLSLTFPISIIHILTIRRLYIKGIPSAVFSISGYLIGQIFFIICVIFGFRNIITPWFTLEPLNYLLGLLIIFRLIYTMTQENLRELNGWNQPQYKNFFVISFILAWCEQSSIFQYLGNLNFGPSSSLLEINTFSTNFNTFVDHTLYIFGLSLGCILFTIFWGIVFLQIKNLFIRYTPLFLSNFIQSINTGSFILAIGLSLSSIPFYGFDYLATAPFGFVSQDRVFKNTIFDQYNIKDSVLGLGISSQFASLDIDVSPFDRGRYIVFPERTMPFDFEDLNYRGEAEWTTRYDKVSTVTDSRAGFLSLAKLFKKQKTEENVGSSRQTEDNQNLLPLKSKFSTQLNAQAGLETKESRFNDWYTLDPTISPDDGKPLESIFAESQDTTFPLDFARITSVEPGNIDLKIKQKYYSNPIYKNLLSLDIDLLLNRQPTEFRLNANQELDLYTKRRVLTAYYDSLRDYSKLPYSTEFENFFDGTKSFSNKIYNQQFKGTLRSVSRLFSLTTDPDANTTNSQIVLKYDQPLYSFPTRSSFSSYHEELVNNTSNSQSSGFLDNILSGPLYAGWDEKVRKFVITNKFLPRTLAGYKINLNPDLESKFMKTNKFKNDSQSYKIKFTSWPINQKILDQGKTNSLIPFVTLYTPSSEFGTAGDPAFDNLSTLPGNWETRNRRSNIGLGQTYENIFDYLAPQRGGFIWPGNKKLDFKLNQ
nr:hypothetical protein [Chlorella desiccata (nom. nud.)]